MNRRLLLLIVILVVLVVLAALMENEESPSTEPAVFPNIEQESDCQILQDIFDNAEHAGDGARERGDLTLSRAHTDAMGRADDRMREVGCYD